MDLTPLVFGAGFSWENRLEVSLWLGLVLLAISYLVDRRTKEDFAFWGYLFGRLAFWGGLSLMNSHSQFSKFMYCMFNAGLMVVSILLQRRVFMVFGAVGVLGYIAYLSYEVFENSALFPFALSAIGLAVIFAGVLYHRHLEGVESSIRNAVPAPVRRLLPTERVAH